MRALAAGADGAVAGTRFLLTYESRAHPEYQRRILDADKTFRTTLFGLAWPAPHRVVANAATKRWCHDDGTVKLAPRLINARSRLLAKLPDRAIMPVLGMQTPRLPVFSPVAPTAGMPESLVDRAALRGAIGAAPHICDFCQGGCRRADPKVNNEGMTGVLFFDGACGMCTRARNFLVRHDRTGDLRTEPFQAAGAAERLGIPEPRLSESSWWLDESGAVYGGAEGVNAALSVALGTRLPLIIYRIPGIRQLQETVYRWVANHRYRFPGTTPYCESHPVAC